MNGEKKLVLHMINILDVLDNFLVSHTMRFQKKRTREAFEEEI